MLKTTTSNIEGREINRYLEIVVGEAILGAVRDIVSGLSS